MLDIKLKNDRRGGNIVMIRDMLYSMKYCAVLVFICWNIFGVIFFVLFNTKNITPKIFQ